MKLNFSKILKTLLKESPEKFRKIFSAVSLVILIVLLSIVVIWQFIPRNNSNQLEGAIDKPTIKDEPNHIQNHEDDIVPDVIHFKIIEPRNQRLIEQIKLLNNSKSHQYSDSQASNIIELKVDVRDIVPGRVDGMLKYNGGEVHLYIDGILCRPIEGFKIKTTHKNGYRRHKLDAIIENEMNEFLNNADSTFFQQLKLSIQQCLTN